MRANGGGKVGALAPTTAYVCAHVFIDFRRLSMSVALLRPVQ